ncbi:geranylgeranyl pyrophosphate synthase [Talaromyces proteolyticus]|uniref:Geranylgeranyl pyrophosphate synthase n=1 Tax=Talaromyces proteolyticus TaxID=1131652 RepID=A0AAD4Q6K1_9EURO|nr:geranylgeranyl pyrophosphate synthase [Talaromyces proteolyticus]KAH8705417.1 geranylgeranyl pyrophosphate synthase [Talaromyces proteolyticus]
MPQATSVLEPSLGVKHFASEVISTFASKQGVEGQVLISKCLKGWIEPSALAPETEPTSFEESVAHRILDVGTIALRGILEFSLGIILSEEDTEHVQELVYIADRIVANTNDYFSWEVERDGSGRLQNSVKVMMVTEGKSEQEAKERLKATILADEQKFQELLERFYVTFPEAPDHMKKFVKGLQLYLGGHHIWCSACDRYKIKTTAIENGANYISTDFVKDQLYSQDSMPTNLGDSALLAPVEYILSLPSKNMRSRVIDAMNLWFQLPDDQLATIKCVVDDLHNSTLMLDDIQDSSDLRRGCAATHQVFGIAQTTNSATYMVARAASTVVTYQDQYPQLINIFLDGTKALALGQSWDLDWRFTGYCPSIAEYMAMVDGKTGAMFDMIIRMMHCFSCTENLPIADLSRLTRLLGRWYQIRDDYQNIQDEHYTAQKGFCEDFDEGKLSYPVTVCCNLDPRAGAIVMGILRQRGNHGTSLPTSVKRQVLDKIRQTGALQQTWEALQNLERDTEAVLVTIESITGKPNPSFRTFVKLLSNVSRP